MNWKHARSKKPNGLIYENPVGDEVEAKEGTGLYEVYWKGSNAPKLYATLEYSSNQKPL